MERREFCALFGGCALCVAAGGLSGCARLLDRTGDTAPAARMAQSPSAASTASAGSGTATSTGSASARPDLVVFRGEDPKANVRAAIAALGGMGRFVKRGGLVVIKPNVLTGRPPQYATTTNPGVMSAIVAMCLESGARDVVVLDRPTSEPRTAFDTAELTSAVGKAGGRVKFLTDRNFEKVSIPQGRILTSWPLVTDVFEADTFINVPIAKTHDIAGLTLSMKNLMGIMGGERGTMHQDFPNKIADVNSLVKPHLVILDAYRMLIRNGPTGGNLSDVKVAKTVVAGTSQVAVDAMGATLFGWEPSRLDYLRVASERGLGIIDLGKLSIVRGQA